MKTGFFRIATPIIFFLVAVGIFVLVYYPPPWNLSVNRNESVQMQPRVVVPRNSTVALDLDNSAEIMAREDSLSARAPLADGEVVVAVLTGYFDGGLVEKQFVAYRNLMEVENTIYLTFIDYDEATRSYKRVWSARTAATRPGTVSLYAQDLVGDRSTSVLLHGMNGMGERTLTIFRKNPSAEDSGGDDLFTRLAEIRIDGTITVREVARTQAYQSGQSRGQSFTISAFGRDMDSSNILDQVEIVYGFNEARGVYEQRSRTRIPGAQVEQQRVQDILRNSRAFEEFVSGLWYHVTSQGTIDRSQYIFFNPQGREIIFYGDETLQVFMWQGSSLTRSGLYVSTQNSTVSTLRRTIDIELESLEGIRVRVIEDVRLSLGVSAPWDGSYRKAGPLENRGQRTVSAGALIDAAYDSSLGKLRFLPDGSFELTQGSTVRQGKYAFFNLGAEELLELRPMELRYTDFQPESYLPSNREVYLIEGAKTNGRADVSPPQTLNLLRVRLGARGIVRLNERAMALTLVE